MTRGKQQRGLVIVIGMRVSVNQVVMWFVLGALLLASDTRSKRSTRGDIADLPATALC